MAAADILIEGNIYGRFLTAVTYSSHGCVMVGVWVTAGQWHLLITVDARSDPNAIALY